MPFFQNKFKISKRWKMKISDFSFLKNVRLFWTFFLRNLTSKRRNILPAICSLTVIFLGFHLFGSSFSSNEPERTSIPLCWAEQLLIFKLPEIKSFWTSTINMALMGRTIWKKKLISQTRGSALVNVFNTFRFTEKPIKMKLSYHFDPFIPTKCEFIEIDITIL